MAGSACGMYSWIAREIAWADQHMDESLLKLTAGLNNDLHFVELTTVQRKLRQAIAIADPTYFGAALHQYQDWWSHMYEGYGVNRTVGHAPDSIRAEKRHLGLRNELIYEFYGAVATGWRVSVDETGVEETRTSLSYLGANLSQLSHSQLRV